MKNLKKVLVTTLVALCLVFNVTAIAGAAATYTDGVYDADSTVDANGSFFKMHVEIVDGQVDYSTFEWWNGTNKLSAAVLDYVAEDARPGMQAVLDQVKAYGDQLYELKDGAAVVAAADDTGTYAAFQECWTKFVELASDSEEAVATTDNTAVTTTDAAADTTTTDVPKTGVVGLGVVYGLGAFAMGAFVLKKKAK